MSHNLQMFLFGGPFPTATNPIVVPGRNICMSFWCRFGGGVTIYLISGGGRNFGVIYKRVSSQTPPPSPLGGGKEGGFD